MSISASRVTRFGLAGQIWRPAGDFSGKALAAPVFSGTIPDISVEEKTGTHDYDYSTYFTGATSYSIAPAVETGWTFNTSTGILTIDTDDVTIFGPYTVTGTNASGSDDSNAFSIAITEGVAETQGGSWLPPKIVTTKLKKKDEEILKSIYELVAKLDESPVEPPKALVQRAEKVETRAKKVINLDSIKEHDQQIKLVSRQIETLEKAVNLQIKKAKQDEDDAINALLSIL